MPGSLLYPEVTKPRLALALLGRSRSQNRSRSSWFSVRGRDRLARGLIAVEIVENTVGGAEAAVQQRLGEGGSGECVA